MSDVDFYLQQSSSDCTSSAHRWFRMKLRSKETLEAMHRWLGVPRSRRRAAAIASSMSPLRLNLGCGPVPLAGWVNIDIAGSSADLIWDLRRGLPYSDMSCTAIFHEHTLEHLTLGDGLAMLRECHRVLLPGGVLRLGVPDFGAYVRSYVDDGRGILSSVRPGRPTLMFALQEVIYGYGHRAVFDEETLATLLVAAGFDSPRRRDYGDSAMIPCPDSEARRDETLYMETAR